MIQYLNVQLKIYNSMIFSIFWELGNHHWYLISEHFQSFQKKLHTYWESHTPTTIFSQPLPCCCCCVTSVMSDSVRRHRRQPTRLPHPWDSPGKNTGVGCHSLLQCMKVKSESEVAQSCPPLSDPMDCSLPGSSIHRTFQARVLETFTLGNH